MTAAWEVSRRAFAEAARWFVQTAGAVDRWDAAGLGEWDVRALVGHTSRSLLTVEEYLERPAEAVEAASAAEYYRRVSALAASSAVAARGREAGAALGAEPGWAVAEIASCVLVLVEARDGSELLTTIAGGMRLADYLPTRTVELVVHTADLAVALGLPPEPPPSASLEALHVLSEVAVIRDLAATLLLAMTGRTELPAGFSVL